MKHLKLFIAIGILCFGVLFSGIASLSKTESFNEKILQMGEMNSHINHGRSDKYFRIDKRVMRENFQPFSKAGLFHP